MAFVRVTDPELARELRANNLLYEQAHDEDVPTPIRWGWTGRDWNVILDYTSWKFYMYLED